MYSFKLENDSANIVDINDGVHYIVVPPVSGLNPPSASIFTSKSPNRKGVKYNGSSLDERNIILTIKILGDIEVNRNALYSWIDTEQYVKMYYSNGVKSVYCEGHVQECAIDLFTNNEVISLAIICENPYFKDLQEIYADISTLLRQFTCPFSIGAEGDPFSTIRSSNLTNIYNDGAETGCKIIIFCNGAVSNLSIYDGADVTRKFKIKTTLQSGWTVIIDSTESPRTVKAYATNGTVTNLMRYVDANPTWFTLKKGNNLFGHTADSGDENAEISVSFTNLYMGV